MIITQLLENMDLKVNYELKSNEIEPLKLEIQSGNEKIKDLENKLNEQFKQLCEKC